MRRFPIRQSLSLDLDGAEVPAVVVLRVPEQLDARIVAVGQYSVLPDVPTPFHVPSREHLPAQGARFPHDVYLTRTEVMREAELRARLAPDPEDVDGPPGQLSFKMYERLLRHFGPELEARASRFMGEYRAIYGGNLVQYVERYMQRQEMDRAALTAATNIPPDVLGSILDGGTTPTQAQVMRLCRAMKVSPIVVLQVWTPPTSR